MRTLVPNSNVTAYQAALDQIYLNESKQKEVKESENVTLKGIRSDKDALSLIFEGKESHDECSLITFSSKVPNYIVEKVMDLLRSEEISLL